MKPFDLDAAKQAWQAEPSGSGATDIRRLEACLRLSTHGSRPPSSVGLDARLRRAAMMDLGLKAVLLFAWILTFLAFDAIDAHPTLFVVVSGLLATGLALQRRILVSIPRIDPGASSTLSIHRIFVNYYASHARLSAFVQALTAPMLFVVGSSLYLFFKYRVLPEPGPADWVVFLTGFTLAFLLGFIPLLFVHERQRRYLAANLAELESEMLDPARVARHRTGTRRLAIVMAALLLAGAVALAVLMLRMA